MGFADAIKASLWESVMYKTTKMVKTQDKMLITLHLTFMTSISLFTFLSIVVFHNYMIFEVPNVNVALRVDAKNFDAVAGNSTGLSYCAADVVDYVVWLWRTLGMRSRACV